MSLDHGSDDRAPKDVEFLVIHLESFLRFGEGSIPLVFRQQAKVVAQLADGKCVVQLLGRPVGLIDQRLRKSRKRFCYRAHAQVPPCGCSIMIVEPRRAEGPSGARPCTAFPLLNSTVASTEVNPS
jgi:hypothetical protein